MSDINGIQPMTVEEFFAIPNGTHVYNYGNDQCVALANLYDGGALGLPIPPGIQSAFEWWTLFSERPQLTENFIQVADTPQKGDIFIGRYGPYQAENGHIGIVSESWDGSTFGTMEQGVWSGYNGYVTRLRRNMSYILGFLRPKQNVLPPVIEDSMKLYRNQDSNEVAAISLDTGNIWVVPNYDYLILVQGWHLFENDEPISLPDNVFGLVKSIATGGVAVDTVAIAKAVVAELGSTQINVDAIAQAIADKIDCGCGSTVPDLTTKAEILSSIEANYPEDK